MILQTLFPVVYGFIIQRKTVRRVIVIWYSFSRPGVGIYTAEYCQRNRYKKNKSPDVELTESHATGFDTQN